MSFWFRHRRRRRPRGVLDEHGVLHDLNEPNDDPREDAATEERLAMATNHMIAFVLIIYGLFLLCKYGFGWDPIKDPAPPSYTLHIRGITDDDRIHKAGGLRGFPD